MGFLNDIKKVLFGAKSVTKSAADRAAQASREAGEELLDKAGTLYDQAKDQATDMSKVAKNRAADAMDKARDVAGDLSNQAEGAFDRAKDFAEDIGEKIWDEASDGVDKVKDLLGGDDDQDAPLESMGDFSDPAPSTADVIKGKAAALGDKAMDAGEQLAEKAMAASEKVGEKVLDVGEKVTERLKDTSEKVGKKVLEATDKLMDRAEEVGAKVQEKVDEIDLKAKEMRAEEANEQARRDAAAGFPDAPIDTEDSALDGHDSFFQKAARFAEGDYHNDGGKTKITESDGLTISKDEDFVGEDKKADKTVPGFEDLDGDGDELIDDAIIES